MIKSDHKPHEAVEYKSLSQTPPHLQRMLFRLQPYDMTIKYRPGMELLLAEAMSRMNPKPGATIELEETIHAVKWSDKEKGDLHNAREEDEELRPLKEVIRHGWPDRQQELSKISV